MKNESKVVRNLSSRFETHARARNPRSTLGEVQDKGLNHAIDNATFRRRSPLSNAPKKGKQLTHDNIDDRRVFVSEAASAFALENRITDLRQIFGDRSANNEFQKVKIVVIKFPKQIGLIRPQSGVGRRETHDDCVVVDVAQTPTASVYFPVLAPPNRLCVAEIC